MIKPGLGLTAGFYKRIVVSFDDETFDQIRAMAVAKKKSFAATVRDLVEVGLETDIEGK